MKRALIEPGGRVAQVVEAADEFQVAPPLVWVNCPDVTQQDDTYLNGVFTPKAVPVVNAEDRIDAIAEAVRKKYVPYLSVIPEYQEAEAEATAFKAAGYAGNAPPTVDSWATAKGWTAQQACDDILSAAAGLRFKLQQIRSVRLSGKVAVAAGTKTLDQVLAELRAL